MQYEIEDERVVLRVKRALMIIIGFMFFFSLLCFLLPLSGIIGSILRGNGIQFGFVLSLIIFGLLGFYMLRMSLWNTYGKEVFSISDAEVNYFADYGWFKDSQKTKEINPLSFSIRPIGYEDSGLGALTIGEGNSIINCVTKMPIGELQELIDKLEKEEHFD